MIENFRAFPEFNEGKICGVYVLVHVASGNWYIGSSDDLYSRRANHESQLRRGVHYNHALQEAYNIHNQIDYICLHTPTRDIAFEIEEMIIQSHRASGFLFNVADDVYSPNKGRVFSEETRRKISEARTGMTLSPDHVEKVRLANIGKKRTPEFCEQMRQLNIGRERTPVQLETMRKYNTEISKKVSVDGIIYESMSAAARAHEVAVSTVRQRVNSQNFHNWKNAE